MELFCFSIFFTIIGYPETDSCCRKSKVLKGVEAMNVYAYAGFSYLFTAAISLFMIGMVVLLNKLMGSGSSNGEGME